MRRTVLTCEFGQQPDKTVAPLSPTLILLVLLCCCVLLLVL